VKLRLIITEIISGSPVSAHGLGTTAHKVKSFEINNFCSGRCTSSEDGGIRAWETRIQEKQVTDHHCCTWSQPFGALTSGPGRGSSCRIHTGFSSGS